MQSFSVCILFCCVYGIVKGGVFDAEDVDGCALGTERATRIYVHATDVDVQHHLHAHLQPFPVRIAAASKELIPTKRHRRV